MKKTNENRNQRQIRKEKGITLIALVVTIIILIILAGITFSVITGNNGIVDKAHEAEVAMEVANFKEKVKIAQLTLDVEIAEKKTRESGYIATTSDNFNELVEHVAKQFGILAEDIITSSRQKEYKIASTQDTMLQIASATVKQDGYTISSGLDIIGDSSTSGHGYITIWYTSKTIKSSVNQNSALNTYKIADELDGNLGENQAMLVAIIHVQNYSSELLTFDLNDGSTTNYGLTSIENAGSDAQKKFKETGYAVYTKEYSTLTLNANDGTNKKQEERVKVGNAYIIPVNPYTRDGYIFKKWNTKQDGTGIDYNPGDSITGTNSNVQLYACWEPIEYTISYELNGGTLVTNPSNYTIESNDITLNQPSKEGYYFTGWTGSNGNVPQSELVITKGSIGDKTYTANYAQYSQASLRKFNVSDANVSWSFNSGTGEYTIIQKAKSSGWGSGVVCDDSTTNIDWGKNYMLEFELQVPNTYTLKTDGNTMFVSNGEGNDIYGTSWLIVDGVRTDGEGYGNLPKSTTITGGDWHKVQMYLINNNSNENPNHNPIRSFSGFALDLSGVTSDVTYKMRNLKSIVY